MINIEPPTKSVSERMKKVRSSGSRIEIEMKKILNDLSIKYVEQPKIIGTPDFMLKGTKVLIYCDSSFWHGRRENELNGKAFSRNKSFWMKKLQDNKKRDERIRNKLRRTGWSVHRFWDTDILKNQDKIKNRLERIVDANNG